MQFLGCANRRITLNFLIQEIFELSHNKKSMDETLLLLQLVFQIKYSHNISFFVTSFAKLKRL